MRKWLILLLFCSLPAVVSAQDEEFSDFSALDLEALLNTEVETGGGFGKQSLSDVPAVVEVWTRDDLQRLGIRTLDELVEHLTGTYRIYTNLAPFIFYDVQLRGGNSARRIALMVDQHSQLDAFDESYNIFAIPIDAIERVEFLRGPAAVLYGSSAMAGVLRVVTRDPQDSAVAGSVAANLLDPPNGIDASVGAARRFGTDWRARLDVQGGLTNRGAIDFERDEIGGSGRFPQQTTWVSLLGTVRNDGFRTRVQYHYQQALMQGFLAAVSAANEPSTMHLFGTEMRYEGRQGDWQWDAQTAVDYRRRELDFGRFPPTAPLPGHTDVEQNRTILRYNAYVVEGQADVTYARPRWQARVGLQNRSRYVNDFDLRFRDSGAYNPLILVQTVRGLINDLNVFMQGTAELHENLSLLGGVRLNIYDPRVWGFPFLTRQEQNPSATFSPMGRGALVWHAHDRVTLKALYGRAFRLPSMLEMFSAVATVVMPNPMLKPEIQDSWELVVDTRPLDTLTVRANGFLNAIRDSIMQLPVSSTSGETTQFDNVEPDVLYTWGADLGVTWLPWTPLRIDLSATFHEGRWDRGNGLKDGEYLRSMPRVLAKGAATLKLFENSQPLWITPSVVYRGRYGEGGSATWVHAHVRWEPAAHWALFLTGRNLTDTRAFTTLGDDGSLPIFREAGRIVRLGVEATF